MPKKAVVLPVTADVQESEDGGVVQLAANLGACQISVTVKPPSLGASPPRGEVRAEAAEPAPVEELPARPDKRATEAVLPRPEGVTRSGPVVGRSAAVTASVQEAQTLDYPYYVLWDTPDHAVEFIGVHHGPWHQVKLILPGQTLVGSAFRDLKKFAKLQDAQEYFLRRRGEPADAPVPLHHYP